MKDFRVHLYVRERGKPCDREHEEFRTEEYGDDPQQVVRKLAEDIAEWLLEELEDRDEDESG